MPKYLATSNYSKPPIAKLAHIFYMVICFQKYVVHGQARQVKQAVKQYRQVLYTFYVILD